MPNMAEQSAWADSVSTENLQTVVLHVPDLGASTTVPSAVLPHKLLLKDMIRTAPMFQNLKRAACGNSPRTTHPLQTCETFHIHPQPQSVPPLWMCIFIYITQQLLQTCHESYCFHKACSALFGRRGVTLEGGFGNWEETLLLGACLGNGLPPSVFLPPNFDKFLHAANLQPSFPNACCPIAFPGMAMFVLPTACNFLLQWKMRLIC